MKTTIGTQVRCINLSRHRVPDQALGSVSRHHQKSNKLTTQASIQHRASIRRTRAGKLAGITIATLLGMLAVPSVNAGLADDIKSKVSNTNMLTSRINARTSNLMGKADDQIQRLDEVGSTVHSVIAETDIIKRAIEPLEMVQQLKDRFSGAGIDPSEILNMIDFEELRSRLDDLRQENQVIQDAMNDPGLEEFRFELIGMLDGLDGLILDRVQVEPSPLQTVIERAPTKLLAVIKLAWGDDLDELIDLVSQVSAFYAEHDDEFDTGGSAMQDSVAAYRFAKEKVCNASREAQIAKLFRMVDTERRLHKIVYYLEKADLRLEPKLDRDFDVGIHGYVLTTINPYKTLGPLFKYLGKALTWKAKRLGRQSYKLQIIVLAKECG